MTITCAARKPCSYIRIDTPKRRSMTHGVSSSGPSRSTRIMRAPLRCCHGLTCTLISNRSMAIIPIPLRAAALIHAGEPARAIEILEANMRLDPFQPLIYATSWLGMANYTLKHYAEAARLWRECTSRFPNVLWPHEWLAAAHAQSGQLEEARAEAAEVLRINPGFTIQGIKRLFVYKSTNDAEHILDGLRKAGLPE